VQHKYTPKDLEVMVRTYGERSEVRSLSNCCLKSGRRALNAQTEINLIREIYATWPVYGGEFDLDKEKRDREMVKVVGEEMYLQKWTCSSSPRTTSSAPIPNAEKVPAFLLRYPKDVPSALPYDPGDSPSSYMIWPSIRHHLLQVAWTARLRGLVRQDGR